MIQNILSKKLALIFLVILGLNEISTSKLNDEDYSDNDVEYLPESILVEKCTDMIESPIAWYSESKSLRETCLIYLKLDKQKRSRSAFPFLRERKFFALHMNKNSRLDQNEVSNARGFKYGK
jgi:hypothetical protein